MGCLVAVLALVSPRLVLVILWLFTNLVDRAFDSIALPILGFILAPFTTVIYVLAYQPIEGVGGFGWILVFIGLMIDLGAYGGTARSRRTV
jgi:hypothetical protein